MWRPVTVLAYEFLVVVEERHAPTGHAASRVRPAQLHLHPCVPCRGGGGDGRGGGHGSASVSGSAASPAAEEEAPRAEEAGPRLPRVLDWRLALPLTPPAHGARCVPAEANSMRFATRARKECSSQAGKVRSASSACRRQQAPVNLKRIFPDDAVA